MGTGNDDKDVGDDGATGNEVDDDSDGATGNDDNDGMLSLERYGDQQHRRRACPEFVADRAMFLMLLEVILFLDF